MDAQAPLIADNAHGGHGAPPAQKRQSAGAVVSKSEFARLLGVSPAAISQHIKSGKIRPGSLIGEGRSAKVHVSKAKADLRDSIDPGQRLGNGWDTKLEEGGPLEEGLTPDQPFDVGGIIDRQMKIAKLEQLDRSNRMAAAEEARKAGHLVARSEAEASINDVILEMLSLFEGAKRDFAKAMAAEFSLTERDVQLVLNNCFETFRAKAAAQMDKKLHELPVTKKVAIEVQNDALQNDGRP